MVSSPLDVRDFAARLAAAISFSFASCLAAISRSWAGDGRMNDADFGVSVAGEEDMCVVCCAGMAQSSMRYACTLY